MKLQFYGIFHFPNKNLYWAVKNVKFSLKKLLDHCLKTQKQVLGRNVECPQCDRTELPLTNVNQSMPKTSHMNYTKIYYLTIQTSLNTIQEFDRRKYMRIYTVNKTNILTPCIASTILKHIWIWLIWKHVTTSHEDSMKECWRPTLKEHPGLFNDAVNSKPVTDVRGFAYYCLN